MNLHATEPGQLRDPRGGPMKFLYASGSRPLDGYTIKRGVGRGGFGEVYYATSDGGKEVALKLIRRNLDVELRGVVQCLNLKHPNLLALYDIREDAEGDTWVVMEYVAGEPLDQAITRHGDGLPREEVLQWMHGIGAGVAYLHDHGIVHRDLKPGNVFCDEGVVKLGDYGLSKFISASRRSGQTESVGTVHYMAPEVANGRYGKEIDIYALGIMLYEMLTGRVPFEGESVGEVLMKHLTAQPDLSCLAEPFRTVAARALEKDPQKRIGSVGEMLAMLPRPAAGSGPLIAEVVPADRGQPTGVDAAGAYNPGSTTTGQPAHDEEPVWRAVRENWNELKAAWDNAELNIFIRGAILFVAAIVVISMAWIWITAIGMYGIYRIVRSIVLATSDQKVTGPSVAMRPPGSPLYAPPPAAAIPMPAAPPPQPMSPFAPSRGRHRRHARRHEQATLALPLKSPRDKVTELFGSMLASTLVSSLVCALLMLVTQPQEPARFAWLALVTTLGSWTVLVPAKFWEGTEGDPTLRRLVLFVGGLALGAFAWGMDQALVVDLPYPLHPQVRAVRSVHNAPANAGSSQSLFYDHEGAATVLGSMAYFSFLLLVPGWWRLANPVRKQRLSLWTTAMYGLWAVILGKFWPFPENWAAMAAATMALSVQLASPWVNTRDAAQRAAEEWSR